MSQKTNPISLRLQKTNKDFSSCWYSDYFYSQSNDASLTKGAYLHKVIDQAACSQLLLYTQEHYRRSYAYMLMLDARAIREEREKQLHVNLLLPNRNKRYISTDDATHQPRKRGELTAHLAPLLSAREGPKRIHRHSAYKTKHLIGLKSFFYMLQGGTPAGNNPEASSMLGLKKDTASTGKKLFSKSLRDLVLHRCLKTRVSYVCERAHIPFATQPKTATLAFVEQKPDADNLNAVSPPLMRVHRLIENEKAPSLARPSTPPLLPPQAVGSALSGDNQHHKQNGNIDAKQNAENRAYTHDVIPLQLLEISNACFKDISLDQNSHYQYKNSISSLAAYLKPSLHSGQHGVTTHHGAQQTQEIAAIRAEHLEVSNRPDFLQFSTIYPIRVLKDLQDAQLLVCEIAYLIQKRVSFAQIRNQILRELASDSVRRQASIKGIRMSCSGRVSSRSKKAQKSKTQLLQWGDTSLHVFESKLSFARKDVHTPFGTVGIKVWLCYK